MSIPPNYTPTRSRLEPVEDCRDFLRTGRCKYGASCKYNHPPNVLSGGGMKAPPNPTEPLFPVRPNEPVCQYYMKHGTCKFGQACKFHHPPQATQQTLLNGGAVVMMPRDSTQLILNPVGADSGPMMVQFLPQRPDEADCIYFLKNGRCKYGATCRYHHPLNYHQRRAEEQRRHREQRRNQLSQDTRYQPAQVHYVSQPVPAYAQGPVYVTESPVTYVNVADREGIPSYQPLPVITGSDGVASYSVPLGSTVATEQLSSASSIASSYDTSVSNIDPLSFHAEGGNSLWNRRNGSGNSLSTHGDTRSQSRLMLPHSASDGNIARRNRTASHGSVGDHPSYYDSGIAHTRQNSSAGSWLMERGGSFDHSQPSVHVSPGRSASTQARRNIRRPPRAREGDEGFTMMTSSLLHILDTPEEVALEGVSDEDITPQAPAYRSAQATTVESALFERLSLNPVNQNGGYESHPVEGGPPSWTPVVEQSIGKGIENHSQAIQFTHSPQRQAPPAGSSQDPDVGLYLP